MSDNKKRDKSSKRDKSGKRSKDRGRDKDGKDKDRGKGEAEQPQQQQGSDGLLELFRKFKQFAPSGTLDLEQYLRLLRSLEVPLPATLDKVVSDGAVDELAVMLEELTRRREALPARDAQQPKAETHHPGGLEFPFSGLTEQSRVYDLGSVSVAYNSPLPHLSRLPGEFDDASTALLRRDFLHLQGLLEATLAPRIENEVRLLERVEETKNAIKKKGKKLEEEMRAEVEAAAKRLRDAVEDRCKKADDVGAMHRKMLDKISQFQFLAAGPRPRDALRMDALPAAAFSSALSMGGGGGGNSEGGDPVLASLQRQRERAQAAFQEQERFPHPLVMRDFVSLFKDFQTAAQKISDTPYSQLDSVTRNAASRTDKTPAERLEALLTDEENKLPREILSNKESARETARLREEVKLKDQMLFTMVREREQFEADKQAFLQQVDDLAEASTTELKSWVALHSEDTQALQAKVARLQEENRLLRERGAAAGRATEL